jgi:hypothetical protein
VVVALRRSLDLGWRFCKFRKVLNPQFSKSDTDERPSEVCWSLKDFCLLKPVSNCSNRSMIYWKIASKWETRRIPQKSIWQLAGINRTLESPWGCICSLPRQNSMIQYIRQNIWSIESLNWCDTGN